MLVSIIIPTYNRAEMVAEAIESACSQTWPHKEIIVIDDGSTDGTDEVVRKFGDQIKYLFIENSGVSKARNIGIYISKGELIAFLDSDDLWKPEKLEIQVEYFQRHHDISICQTEEVWIRNGKRVNPRNVHKKHSGWIFEHCIPLCIISPSAVMMRRNVFDDIGFFDEAMPACEDYDMWLRAALKYQIVTLPDALIVKRGGHSDQLSKNWGLDMWRIHALEKLLKSGLKDKAFEELVKKDIYRRSRIIVQGADKRGNRKLRKRYLELMNLYSI